jgi:Calcineurin-like phosphoesterase
MNTRTLRIALIAALTFLVETAAAFPAPAPKSQAAKSTTARKKPASRPWKFAASGDSRNCGDVVMPAIAAGVKAAGARFYWHLGDFRKLSSVDEDIAHQPEHLGAPLSMPQYLALAWSDFIESQLKPFGTFPVYVTIGNHEMVTPKTRSDYIAQFRRWIDRPNLRAQRLQDDPGALEPKIYYHWIERGIDFIALDNATPDQFDPDQTAWFEKTLHSAAKDSRIRTVVVGTHEALPESISANHSMDQSSPAGLENGRRVYADLLKFQNEDHKRVYILASHSHYYMEGTFNTPYWREHGGVLPGWIVGTAGAQRYPLPPEASDAIAAQTKVYGFLIGTAYPNGRIQFAFHQLSEQDVTVSVARRYAPEFVHWCFAENYLARWP